MKVIHNAENDNFKIVDFPLWIGVLFVPLCLFYCWQILKMWSMYVPLLAYLPLLLCALAGLLAVLQVQRSEFEFDVINGQLTWQRHSIFGRKAGTIPFHQIEYAVVQCTRENGNFGASYRVALSTAQGMIPLTNSYTKGQEHDEQCQQIRSLINRALGVELASESDNDIREMERQGDISGAKRLAKARGKHFNPRPKNGARIEL